MGGHFVQGHVDTVAEIVSTTQDGNAITFRLKPRDKAVLRYIVEKGYVTLDGASLTVTAVHDDEAWWEVMLIAYTQEKVVMGSKKKGEDVNVEVDMVGKYVEKSVAAYFEGNSGSGGAMLEKMVQRLVDERLKGNAKNCLPSPDMTTGADATTASTEGATPSPAQGSPSLVELFQYPAEAVCEFGDIILVCNDEFHPQLEISASSCNLSSTSKVFKALLSKRFAEGRAVHAGEINEIHVVEEPQLFLSMCSMLHHVPLGQRDIMKSVSASSMGLVNMALLLDKHVIDCLNVTAAAYLMDQPEVFVESTRKLLRMYEAEFHAQRTHIFSEIANTVTSIVHRFTAAAHQIRKPNLVIDLLNNLSNLSLWPLNAHVTSLEKALNGLCNLRIPVLVAPKIIPTTWPSQLRSGTRQQVPEDGAVVGVDGERLCRHG
ncbi:Riboflavin synthase alpha chain [Oleoguttula sp. CCFEE 5521]